MFETYMIAMLAAVPPTIASLAAMVVVVRTNAKVEEVRHSCNSMKDALAFLKGHAEGRLNGIQFAKDAKDAKDAKR